MDSRNLAIAHAVDHQVLISDVLIALIVMTVLSPVSHAALPVFLAVDIVDDFLCQGDGSARRSIELMYVMGFLHTYRVLWEPVHDLSQIAVDGREDSHTDTEIRGPEEGLLTIGAEFLHVFLMVFHPSGRTRNHLHIVGESLEIVAVSGSRVGKLDSHIRRAELRAVDIFRVIYVNLTYDFMATLQGDLFDHVSHLAVAYQSYFHCYLVFLFIPFGKNNQKSWKNRFICRKKRIIIVINRKFCLFLQ